MDGLAIRALSLDWGTRLIGARIDKVHQPSDRELVLTVRTARTTTRLLLSAHRSFARVHEITKSKPQNPTEPPMFCMLMRKRIEGGRIVSIEQQGWDRVIEIEIESTNEIGDLTHYRLIVEMMGKHSNIILCTNTDDGSPARIVDCIVHVGSDLSRVRPVLPGLMYELAPAQDRIAYDKVMAHELEPLLNEGLTAKVKERLFSQIVAGIGPLTAKEILFRAGTKFTEPTAEQIRQELFTLFERVMAHDESASICLDELGRPLVSAPFQFTHCPRAISIDRYDEALEATFLETFTRSNLSQLAQELKRSCDDQIDRLRGKEMRLKLQMEESQHHDEYRIKGELLTAYAYQVHKGKTEVLLPNFYDDERMLPIELDPALSAIENAQRYFKQASKRKRALTIVHDELAQVKSDLDYLDGILVHLQDATKDDLEALYVELQKQGFLKVRKRRKPIAKQPAQSRPDEYISTDGFVIRVGRNNTQNDKLTLRTSAKSDIWFHVKDLPGSHVVVQANQQEVPETTIGEAALLAAYFSKARNSANVAVDYTYIKHIWKPNGARPGHVLYEQQKTCYATPDRDHIGVILSRKQATHQTTGQ